MREEEDKKWTGKIWQQVEPSESRILLTIVIVSAVITLCSVWHLCWQKDNELCSTDTVFVEHTVVYDTLKVNVSINLGDEFSPSRGIPSKEKDE